MTETTAPLETSDAEVMASVDQSSSGERLVIADISRDDAWLSVPCQEAPSLPAWR